MLWTDFKTNVSIYFSVNKNKEIPPWEMIKGDEDRKVIIVFCSLYNKQKNNQS